MGRLMKKLYFWFRACYCSPELPIASCRSSRALTHAHNVSARFLTGTPVGHCIAKSKLRACGKALCLTG